MKLTRTNRRSGIGAAVATAAALALALSACGEQEASESDPGAGDPAPTSTPEATATPEVTEAPTETPTDDATEEPTDDDSGGEMGTRPPAGELPIGEVSDDIAASAEVQEAVADLAGRESVADTDVLVAGHGPLTWRNGALGCPEPGGFYTQALVPGEQLVLEIEGEYYAYHRAEGQPYFYCANPDQFVGDGPADS